jgi:hypothetical protein
MPSNDLELQDGTTYTTRLRALKIAIETQYAKETDLLLLQDRSGFIKRAPKPLQLRHA